MDIKNKKILVAEDEAPMAKALELKLQHAGFSVTTVFDGEEAVKALNADNFDLVLLDLVMPKLDGFGVLEHMKQAGKMVKTIILSNLSQDEDTKRAKELGAQDFFVKSNTPINDIVERVKAVLAA